MEYLVFLYLGFGVLTINQSYANDPFFKRCFDREDCEGKFILILMGLVLWPILVAFSS